MTSERGRDSRQKKWDQKSGPSNTQITGVYFSSNRVFVESKVEADLDWKVKEFILYESMV